jgi:hypothetical protein
MTTLFDDDQPKPTTFDWQAFADFWNQHGNLPRILVMNKERRDKFRARMKNELFARHWRHMVTAMNLDPQYHGDSGWQKSLVEYFLRNDMNWVRVLETHPPGQAVEAGPKKSKWALAAEKCEK